MLRDLSIRTVVTLSGLICLFHCSRLHADEVHWNKDIRQAAEQAAKEKKPLLIMVSAPWCGYCQKMLHTTFQDEKLIGRLNNCFVPVYLDADENEKWVQQLKVDALPTTLLVSSEMKVVKRLSGYQSAEQINGQIVKLCSHDSQVPVKRALAKKELQLAFEGTCLVSLRDDGQLVKGEADWTSTYKDRVLRFASEDHKRRFDAHPELYWPVADGNCLVSSRMDQTLRPGEPVLAMIYADRVWFFADKARQEEFLKNPYSYLLLLAQNAR